MIICNPTSEITLLIAPVPPGTTSIYYDWFSCYLRFYNNDWFEGIELPEGFWKIVATSNEIQEEQAEKLVKKIDESLYKNYMSGGEIHCTSAISSLMTYITSVGFDIKQKFVILEKVNTDTFKQKNKICKE
jgi:hypothetical protein